MASGLSVSEQSASDRTVLLDADEDVAVREFLAILEQHQAECEANHMYVEAQVTAKRLVEMRAHEHKRRLEQLRSQHIAENLDLEEFHLREIEQFNAVWDQQMAQYQGACQEQERALREKHQREQLEYQQQMQEKFLLRPKYSKELLNLRKIEETLAKAKEYTEAQKVKMKGDAMQEWELRDLKKDWERKIAVKQVLQLKQQQAEVDAFQLRVLAGHDKQRRLRQEKLSKILKRYHNLKADLEKKHSQERQRALKSPDSVIIARSGSGSGSASLPEVLSPAAEENGASTTEVEPVSAPSLGDQGQAQPATQRGTQASQDTQTHAPALGDLRGTETPRGSGSGSSFGSGFVAELRTEAANMYQAYASSREVKRPMPSNLRDSVHSQSQSTPSPYATSGSARTGTGALSARRRAQAQNPQAKQHAPVAGAPYGRNPRPRTQQSAARTRHTVHTGAQSARPPVASRG